MCSQQPVSSCSSASQAFPPICSSSRKLHLLERSLTSRPCPHPDHRPALRPPLWARSAAQGTPQPGASVANPAASLQVAVTPASQSWDLEAWVLALAAVPRTPCNWSTLRVAGVAQQGHVDRPGSALHQPARQEGGRQRSQDVLCAAASVKSRYTGVCRGR